MAADGREQQFVLGLDNGTIEADQVVIATGPFQTPRVPQFGAELAPHVFQIHSVDYRVPVARPPVAVSAQGL